MIDVTNPYLVDDILDDELAPALSDISSRVAETIEYDLYGAVDELFQCHPELEELENRDDIYDNLIIEGCKAVGRELH